MPIYEYRCDNCAHEFETIQKVSDAPLTKCPACSEETLRKKVSAAGFRLKGGGWYETDFKGGRKKNVAGDDAKASTSGSDGGAKSDGAKAGADKSGDSAGKSTDTAKSSSDAKSGASKSKASE